MVHEPTGLSAIGGFIVYLYNPEIQYCCRLYRGSVHHPPPRTQTRRCWIFANYIWSRR